VSKPIQVTQRIRLIHWDAAEARERIAQLRRLGYRVEHGLPLGMPELRRLAEDPPAAVVVDLSRRPSQGRDVMLAIRQRQATRHVPLVFLEGEPEKVERIRNVLPDAAFGRWSSVAGTLRRAIASPPAEPVRIDSLLAGYSGTPLPKKLGIKPGAMVGTVGAPENIRKILGDLPEGAGLEEDGMDAGLILWFIRTRKELRSGIGKISRRLKGAVWMIWPKKTSPLASGLTQQEIRDSGLAHGLVDYKVCAVDADWSGLLFTRRKETKA
jgi:CheY-like chemotaxis protein